MKKGFTLLEVIVSAGIASILVSILIPIFLKYNLIYKENTKEYREYFYCFEALMFIEQEINNGKNVRINNNVIQINYSDGITKKYIQQNTNGCIVLVHTENNVVKAVNNILNNISSFTVVQKRNTTYICITARSGERYERCFGIKLET
ncbi:type II secretion system GspH family protein [Clostridium sp. SYSU_GA19001]|uniref:type II secretion system protein n=1 Tax=Clostridium caldaquaticum TaxID=2940653 RepID=UPI002077488C|nr:type II secretion system protein [Clostridium caldaquaticum]MCM8711029.1 type II secretion system GspH family protein [Clostridium caldaquaticum]